MTEDKPENPTVGDVESLPMDVRDMELNLTKEERLRTVALMMGIRYYTETIIKDANYLKLMLDREKEAKFSNNPEEMALWHLRPASVNGVLNCAQEFEAYLMGHRPAAKLMIKRADGSTEIVEPWVDDTPTRGAQDTTEQKE